MDSNHINESIENTQVHTSKFMAFPQETKYQFPKIFKLEQNQNKTNFHRLPNWMIENEVFSFLTSKDLFYSVRPVCSDFNEMMKSLWCNKLKEEMISHVKTIDYLYEKEVLSKTYEFKIEYLYNYRNLIVLYNSNINIILEISNILNGYFTENQNESSENVSYSPSQNEQIKLFSLYLDYFQLYEAKEFIMNKEYTKLKEYSSIENNISDYKNKLQSLMNNISNSNSIGIYELDDVILFKSQFYLINKDLIDEGGESSKLVYSLLQGMIEYELIKYDLIELEIKQKNLLKKIYNATIEWPRKKRFFEVAYKLMLFTK